MENKDDTKIEDAQPLGDNSEAKGAEDTSEGKSEELKDGDSVKKGETESAASGDASTDIVEDSPDKETEKDTKLEVTQSTSSDPSTSVNEPQMSPREETATTNEQPVVEEKTEEKIEEVSVKEEEKIEEAPKAEEEVTEPVEEEAVPEQNEVKEENVQCQSEVEAVVTTESVDLKTEITTPPPTPAETISAPETVPSPTSPKNEEPPSSDVVENDIAASEEHVSEAQVNCTDNNTEKECVEEPVQDAQSPVKEEIVTETSPEITNDVPPEQNCTINGEIVENDSVKSIATVVTWEHGGKEVYVCGDFSQWTDNWPLSEKEGVFSTNIDLPEGKHHFKFMVDGDWTVSNSQPIVDLDGHGQVNMMVIKAAAEE